MVKFASDFKQSADGNRLQIENRNVYIECVPIQDD